MPDWINGYIQGYIPDWYNGKKTSPGLTGLMAV
jgi:hypothetical protein